MVRLEYEGQRAPTAMSYTFALLNKWHRDTGDERVTDELASTTVVTLDLATVGDLECSVDYDPAAGGA